MPNLSSLIKTIRDIMREDRGLSGDGQRIERGLDALCENHG
ncbi:MAG: hypothetical protein R2830_03860 [Saprospiraceae bacterium]